MKYVKRTKAFRKDGLQMRTMIAEDGSVIMSTHVKIVPEDITSAVIYSTAGALARARERASSKENDHNSRLFRCSLCLTMWKDMRPTVNVAKKRLESGETINVCLQCRHDIKVIRNAHKKSSP